MSRDTTSEDIILTDLLAGLTPLPDGGYTLTPETREGFATYLARFGFSLDTLTMRYELLDALSYCNSVEFERLLSQPAPAPHLRFIWQRLRGLGSE